MTSANNMVRQIPTQQNWAMCFLSNYFTGRGFQFICNLMGGNSTSEVWSKSSTTYNGFPPQDGPRHGELGKYCCS